jgi:glutamine transport system substrate-binding protein
MKRVILATFALVMLLSANAWAQKLVVAHDTNFKPFEFKDETGNYTGFDIELWKAIASEIGVEYTFQPNDFNGIIPGLQSATFDAGIAGITIKPERQEVVDFSDPYYDSGLVILVRADNNDIKGIEDLKDKVISTKLATSSADFAAGFAPKDNIKLYPNNDAMFLELLSGGADAVIFDMPVVKDFAQKAGKGQVKVVGPLYQGQSYGIAFPKGSDLKPKVDAALKKLRENGTYEKLYIKWFGYAPAKK